MSKTWKDARAGTGPGMFRSLASKFSLLTLVLVLWVLATLLVYDVFQDKFNLREGLILSAIVALVSLTVSQFTIRLVARPLRKLEQGIQAVRSGRLEPIEISRTGDEIEYLGESFNSMIEALAESRRETREHQELLEARLREQVVQLEAASQAKPAPVIPNPAPARILVVEDNAVNQKVVMTVLRKRGYAIELAQNGKEALAKLESCDDVGLVLMDVQMPVLDGLEATRHIRKDPRWGALPVVAMTAHAMNGDRERCLEAGMNGYVSKPVHPALLLATVEEYLGNRPPVT